MPLIRKLVILRLVLGDERGQIMLIGTIVSPSYNEYMMSQSQVLYPNGGLTDAEKYSGIPFGLLF